MRNYPLDVPRLTCVGMGLPWKGELAALARLVLSATPFGRHHTTVVETADIGGLEYVSIGSESYRTSAHGLAGAIVGNIIRARLSRPRS